MQKERTLTALQPVAIALGYPDARWQAAIADLKDEVSRRQPELASTWAWLRGADRLRLQSLYVATFDFSPKTSLTLTAHLPTHIQPGVALARCVEAVAGAGYALPAPAWADHLPTLLEFVAVVSEPPGDILTWVGNAFARIASHLAEENPYRPLITWVSQKLPRMPGGEGGAFRDPDSEAVGPVPFPLRYDYGR